MEAGGQQDLGLLVQSTAEASFLAFRELCEKGPDLPDNERKIGLLKFISRTRQRLLRLLILAKWCSQLPLIECCQQLVGTLSNHDASFIQAADSLFFLHEGLQVARAPLYDVASAVEVLLTGSYRRLPKCIEDLGMQPMLTGKEKASSLQKLDTLLRSQLLDTPLPKELSSVTVAEGRVTLHVEGEFEVQLTLGYRGNSSLWRILQLDLLVGESTGKVKLTDLQRGALSEDLECRMAVLESPFETLYSVLHEFCTAMVMSIVSRQVLSLRQGRWKEAIRFEMIADASTGQSGALGQANPGQSQMSVPDAEVDITIGKSQLSPGLKIAYWLDMFKGGDVLSLPSIRIEPGPELHIVCSHQPSVIDPVTNDEAEFVLDQSCIDVEKLLLRAISCNIHSRLLEVQRGLRSSAQLCSVESDIMLKFPHRENFIQIQDKSANTEVAINDLNQAGKEVLCVRAYGQSYMTLGINIRNGRFALRSPSSLLPPSALSELEELLNQGSSTPVEVFSSLRNKSLLHLFSSVGTFLDMKIYDKGTLSVNIPGESLKLGPDALIMGFPNSSNSYFLALQLDSSFMPMFTLMEGQSQSVDGHNVLSGSVQIVHFMKIDLQSFLLTEDEVKTSLLDDWRQYLHPGELFSNFDIHTKDCRLGVADGDTIKSMWNSDSGAIQKNIELSAAHHTSVSIGINGSPSSQATLGQASRFAPTNQAGSIGGSLFQNIVSAKSSPGASNLGGQFAGSDPSARNSGPLFSPSKISTFQSLGTGAKSFFHSESEPVSTKSPMSLGETASSPINLDDNVLSKLIDSISSKSAAMSPSNPSTLEDSSLTMQGPRQSRASTPSQGSPLHRNTLHNMRPSGSKNSTVQPNFVIRNTAHSPTGTVSGASPARRSPVVEPFVGRIESADMYSERFDISETARQAVVSFSSPSRVSMSVKITQTANTISNSPLEKTSMARKRKCVGSDLLTLLPSLQGLRHCEKSSKRRKLESAVGGSVISQPNVQSLIALEHYIGQPFSNIVKAANQGCAPVYSYTAILLQVVRRCLLCIKHARITSQMDSCGIPYVEEVGLRKLSTNLWFCIPASRVSMDFKPIKQGWWEHICLCLGKPGSTGWEVHINDAHFRELWELQKQLNTATWGSLVQIVNAEVDSHIRCTMEGLVLSYKFVEDDSIKILLSDLERLWNARTFILGLKEVLVNRQGVKGGDPGQGKTGKVATRGSGCDRSEVEKMWDDRRKAFRIEAIGLTCVWFSYIGSLPGVIARFVVEWEIGKSGCTIHVSPEQLWPHTKFLEDFINGGEVELLLDCIRITAGPLHSLAGAIRPARMPMATSSLAAAVPIGAKAAATAGAAQVLSPTTTSPANPGRAMATSATASTPGNAIQSSHAGQFSAPGRGTGLAPSSLLPTDVSVILRSPYWIRIVYRRQFAVDMRCFAGDQIWVQPAPPPRGGGPGTNGSLPCPQFRPFVMDQITTSYNSFEAPPSVTSTGGQTAGGASTGSQTSPGSGIRVSSGAARPNPASSVLTRVGNINSALGSQTSLSVNPATARGLVPGLGVGLHSSYRELSASGHSFSDDGGYGGVWVSLAALKKVLRGTLRYLGVVWLFTQFPDIIREVLATHLKENEGALLNHDPETPALRFYIQNCVFAVSVHRQQLVLQAINVKRYQHLQSSQQQQQQQTPATGPDNDLSLAEMQEIGDFFARRAAFEPYNASRLASFVTMLILPVPVLREFIGLIAWKKEANKAVQQGQTADAGQPSRPRVELCLENRMGADVVEQESLYQGSSGGSGLAKSSIRYDRPHNTVDFTLTMILDPVNVPHNVAGGAGWLPQCVAVRLRYLFGENSRVCLLSIDGSHGGRACWTRVEDWEHCRERVVNAVELASASSNAPPDHLHPPQQAQGRLRSVAEAVQVALQSALQQLCRGPMTSPLTTQP